MFIPTTNEELKQLNWQTLDVILISGDTYIDSPSYGPAIIGKYLIHHGFKVGIIAQPDINSDKDITRLGEPRLFWGITSGCVDSMVSNYTASKKRRNQDDLTPGGQNNRRPDRALIVYSNLIRRYYKNTVPLVLGGIEASLRRIAHYDYWTNKLRRSILLDAKADLLLYGMAEKSVLELANALRDHASYENINGLCYLSKEIKSDFQELSSFEEIQNNQQQFISMFNTFYQNNNDAKAHGLYQKYQDRYLIHNPPSEIFTQKELDLIYNLPYERDIHPYYQKQGNVKALITTQFSITTHRGCFGECHFCAIAIHQGRYIQSRSKESIIKEAREITEHPQFKGIISDVGGPTANMYGWECSVAERQGVCKNKRCVYPQSCIKLNQIHKKQIDLLTQLRQIKGIKKIFIASGIRYDLILQDKKYGEKYLNLLIKHHISGQMKIAPEHIHPQILELMGKPDQQSLLPFKKLFDRLTTLNKKKLFLTYYFIAAHPGCQFNHMNELKSYIKKNLKLKPEQIQIFTPTPSTYSTLMYYTGIDPFKNKSIFVEKDMTKKQKQKSIITDKFH